eukprot:m51a1_g6186 putative alpha beta-hydrolase (326) ;mRNA; f:48226-52414
MEHPAAAIDDVEYLETLASTQHAVVATEGGGQTPYWLFAPLDGGQGGQQQQAPRVLLVGGIGSTHHVWGRVVAGLCRHGCWVMAADYRGVGRLGRDTPGPWSVALLARDLLRCLEHAGWLAADSQRLHVVGHSMGGMVAQELALAAPERLASLTLAATHSGGGVWRTRPTASGLLMFARCSLAGSGSLKGVHIMLKEEGLWDERAELVPEVLRSMAHICVDGKPPKKAFMKLLGAIRRFDARGRLRQLRGLRCQVLCGTSDSTIPPGHSREIARELGCPLHWLDVALFIIGGAAPYPLHMRLKGILGSGSAMMLTNVVCLGNVRF